MSGKATGTPALEHRQVRAGDVCVHAVLAGRNDTPSILFLHGWPQNWSAFEQVMLELRGDAHVIAIDLPGIGESHTPLAENHKRNIAKCIRALADELALTQLILVGHDAGGQVAYAFLRDYPDRVRAVALMNIVIPGIDPWFELRRNPHIWHFAFHAVPDLPELLVSGREAAYFDYFFEAIAGKPSALNAAARANYARAYARPEALHTGFEWYRAFQRDEADNTSTRGQRISTPVLYLRGDTDASGIPIDRYIQGLRAAGLENVSGCTIPGCGHFAPDEQPAAVASILRDFVQATGKTAAR